MPTALSIIPPVPAPATTWTTLPPTGWLRGLGSQVLTMLTALVVPCFLLVFWQVAASRRWISPQILPAPAIVWATAQDLWSSGELVSNLLISLRRVAYGFAIGTTIGLGLGTVLGLSRPLRAYLYPTFNLIAQIPALGWIPLLMMMLGIGEVLKITIIAKATLVPVALNTMKGIIAIPEHHFEVGRAYGFTRWQTLTAIVIPATVPSLFTGIRYGLMVAWISLVTVELLASSEGIGFVMVYARQLFQLDVVIVSIIVIGVVGLVLDRTLALAERFLLRWRREAF